MFRQVLIFLCTGALAAAVAVYAPRAVPGLSELQALLAGLVVLFAGGLLQETQRRLAGEARAMERVLSLRCAHGRLAEEVEVLSREIAVLREEATGAAPGGDHRVETVIAEVKVLQSLIEKLSDARVAKGGAKGDRAGSKKKVAEVVVCKPRSSRRPGGRRFRNPTPWSARTRCMPQRRHRTSNRSPTWSAVGS
jgi:hypothetical protein